MAVEKILDRVTLVHVSVSMYDGRSQWDPSEHIDGAPPKDVGSMGHLKTFPHKRLNELRAAKGQMYRDLRTMGTRFIGGWLVPDDVLEQALKRIEAARQRFTEYRDNQLVPNFDRWFEEWVAQYPDWEPVLRERAIDASEARRRCQFSYQALKLEPAQTGDWDLNQSLEAGSLETLDAIQRNLIEEIAQDARDWWKKGLKGKAQVNQNVRRTLGRLRQKLDIWSFASQYPDPLIRQIDAIDGELPKSGPISEPQLGQLRALALLLRDPEQAIEHAEQIICSGEVPTLGPSSDLAALGADRAPDPIDPAAITDAEAAEVEPAIESDAGASSDQPSESPQEDSDEAILL